MKSIRFVILSALLVFSSQALAGDCPGRDCRSEESDTRLEHDFINEGEALVLSDGDQSYGEADSESMGWVNQSIRSIEGGLEGYARYNGGSASEDSGGNGSTSVVLGEINMSGEMHVNHTPGCGHVDNNYSVDMESASLAGAVGKETATYTEASQSAFINQQIGSPAEGRLQSQNYAGASALDYGENGPAFAGAATHVEAEGVLEGQTDSTTPRPPRD